MKTIWKFPLDLKEHQTVAMPSGARVLSVQMQQGTPTIWAVVNPSSEHTFRHVFVVGTGQYVPEDKTYIGTVQMEAYVWHVYIEEE